MSSTITVNQSSHDPLAQSNGQTATASQPSSNESPQRPSFVPRFDVWETDEGIVMKGDMPGVGIEDLDIHFEDHKLTVYATVQLRHQECVAVYNEYPVGDFQRTFQVSESIDGESITATLTDGVLTLNLPKSEAVKPRRIEVKAA